MKRFSIVALVLALSLVAAACGKKGLPVPQDKKNYFSWVSSRAEFTPNGCLAVTALMRGATQNVDDFSIELEPLSATPDSTLPPELRTQQDTCDGCPFTPLEVTEISPQKSVADDTGTRYAFTYCPQNKAAAYRWRLVARSVFRAYPYQLTPVQTVR